MKNEGQEKKAIKAPLKCFRLKTPLMKIIELAMIRLFQNLLTKFFISKGCKGLLMEVKLH